MNALDFLKRDHSEVNALIDQLQFIEEDEMELNLFNKLKDALELHMEMEEALFYPAIKNTGHQPLIKHAEDEHEDVKSLLREMDNYAEHTFGGIDFDAYLVELKRLVEHHVMEEESKIFAICEMVFSEEALKELGEKMIEFKTSKS